MKEERVRTPRTCTGRPLQVLTPSFASFDAVMVVVEGDVRQLIHFRETSVLASCRPAGLALFSLTSLSAFTRGCCLHFGMQIEDSTRRWRPKTQGLSIGRKNDQRGQRGP